MVIGGLGIANRPESVAEMLHFPPVMCAAAELAKVPC
jgi:hypothetical protein